MNEGWGKRGEKRGEAKKHTFGGLLKTNREQCELKGEKFEGAQGEVRMKRTVQ